MPERPVHTLSKGGIKKFAVQQRASGRFYDRGNPQLEDNFLGSIDRFCDIAFEFRCAPRVLDAGSGDGLLVALLKMLGHDAFAVDLFDRSGAGLYAQHRVPFKVCNVEADALPFDDEYFDALSCCQAFEHFTHSHLAPVLAMKRVLRPGGILEIDVPNAVSFRNRSRMLRGKHITYDYQKHYLDAEPIVYKGREYYPDRHNREFTRDELQLLLETAGMRDVEVSFLRSPRYREGPGRIVSVTTALRDAVPALRKSLIAFARK